MLKVLWTCPDKVDTKKYPCQVLQYNIYVIARPDTDTLLSGLVMMVSMRLLNRQNADS